MAMVTANAGGLIRTLAQLENDRATKNIKEPEFEMHYPVSLQVLIVIAAVIFAAFAVLGILAIDVALRIKYKKFAHKIQKMRAFKAGLKPS